MPSGWQKTGTFFNYKQKYIMNNPRLEVLANPLAPKNEMPFIRFAPGNGWSVASATVKGCHLPDLAEAVADYNRAIGRKVEGLNVGSVETLKYHVTDLPGWGDAVRDEMNHRHAAPEASTTGARPTLTASLGAGKTRGALGGILPLLALAAMAGAFEDDDDESPVLEGPPSDAMREVLEASRVLHQCPHGVAALAVPRSLGPQWTAQLVEHIKADSVSAVRAMLATAGLMK